MSATAVNAPTREATRIPRSLNSRARDAFAIAQRNLIAYRRVPQLLIFSTIQPIVFVIMFRYVFGGAIGGYKGFAYVDYLMPGVFVQTVVFGSLATAIGLATDMKSGLIERFRSLPMARSAVLTGRTFADLARNVFVYVLMVVVGVIVGFRIHGGIGAFLFSVVLALGFGYAMSWIFATVGLAVGDPETAQAAAFPVLAPLVFASSAFVSTASMPGWLQVWANHQPVTATVNAVRDLCLGLPATGDVIAALAWMIGIVVIFVPISVRLYRRAV
jgi:ABC-2 type transport system permease protein/oleandomycin transport system permease protein